MAGELLASSLAQLEDPWCPGLADWMDGLGTNQKTQMMIMEVAVSVRHSRVRMNCAWLVNGLRAGKAGEVKTPGLLLLSLLDGLGDCGGVH